MYKLEGQCLKCGKCCKLLYSLDDYTAFDFKITSFIFPAYKRFEIIGKDNEDNLMFKCKLLGNDNLCTDYNNRLKMCRNFPNVKYGSLGKVPDGCGYKLVPIKKFNDYLSITAKIKGVKLVK